MAKAYSERVIVLGKVKLGETDAILPLLARDGRQVRAVAKGLRRPGNRFGARLEPFTVVDVLLHPGKNLDVVSEARCVTTNAAARSGLVRPAAASYAAEFLDKLTRDGSAAGERVFALSEAAFAAIAGADDDEGAALLACAHVMKAMAMQGLRPALDACALCGAPVDAGCAFDVGAGGRLCAACAPHAAGPRVDAALAGWVDVLVNMTFAELAELADAPVHALVEVSELWAHEHLGIRLKSATFLKQLLFV